MSRWIDADALIEKCYKQMDELMESTSEHLSAEALSLLCGVTLINSAPSIDIVFCKECRHSFINENHSQKPRICGLTKMCGTTKDDWYCADGERKEP